eukprot:scaffold7203_cov416-Prasinococcus_capsulatus_cf.AAC.15
MHGESGWGGWRGVVSGREHPPCRADGCGTGRGAAPPQGGPWRSTPSAPRGPTVTFHNRCADTQSGVCAMS